MRKFNNILVTGGSGFIGWNFIKYFLKNEKGNILNVDKLTYASKHNYESQVNLKRYKFYKNDICSEKALEIIFKKKIDAIVHFAAETHVDNSISSAHEFVKTNIFGTYNLLKHTLDYLKKKKKKNFIFIHISTDEVFGHLGKKEPAFLESTKYCPRNPYSATKAGADHLVRSFIETYNFPAVILNCCNNYGPFQHSEKLIPKVIENFLKKKKIPIYGKGENIREWIYSEDFARAISLILKKGKIGENYNVGTGHEFNNIKLVYLICEVLKEKLERKEDFKKLITFVKDRQGHDFRYAINSHKIRKQLNWKPIITIKQGLDKTIDYFLKKNKKK